MDIISFSQRTVGLLILGVNIHHSHCASAWLKLCWVDTKPSVITDGEITPAARPDLFACFRDDIHYQHVVLPNRFHRSPLACERLYDNSHNSSPAETSPPAFMSSWFQSGVSSVDSVSGKTRQQTLSATLTAAWKPSPLCTFVANKFEASYYAFGFELQLTADRWTFLLFSATTWKLAACTLKLVQQSWATYLREANHTNHPTSTKAIRWFGFFFPLPFSLVPPGPDLTWRDGRKLT